MRITLSSTGGVPSSSHQEVPRGPLGLGQPGKRLRGKGETDQQMQVRMSYIRWDILGNIQAPNSQSSQRALHAGSEDVPHCHPSQEDNNGRPHSRMTTSNRPEHLHSQLQLSGHGFLPEICQPAHPNTGMDGAGAALLVPLARL